MAAVLRKLIQGRLPALAGVLCRRSGNEGHLFLNSSGSTLMQPRCGYSSPTESVIVEMDKATGVALLKLNIPPVNSLSLPLLTELAIVLDKLEMDKHCRGLILTSAVPNIFSAGLNLFDMMDKPNEHYSEFWRAVQEIWIKLYGSSLANIAAINGSSPAGGCLLALCSDYRIMANNPHFTIGLNETRLGIVAPFWYDILQWRVHHPPPCLHLFVMALVFRLHVHHPSAMTKVTRAYSTELKISVSYVKQPINWRSHEIYK
uniref:Enoyl-CoA delta isomerase 1, mitochondrial n=1 Tax=Eptatretus burgeri TaxID=7764 RepID=A0A8C4NN84_EPTBU